MTATRRLAVLMFTDMVGYSALAFENEQKAMELIAEQRELVRQSLSRFRGRELQTTGDGFFVEFHSAVEAVQCAVSIQTALHERDQHSPRDRKIKLRIGIHLGDILNEDQDLYGNSVNLAARIEPLAPAGGICITRQVHDLVAEKMTGTEFRKLGQHALKNIKSGAEIFQVMMPWEQKKTRAPRNSHLRDFIHETTLNLNASLITALFAVSFAFVCFAGYEGLKPLLVSDYEGARAPASEVSTPIVDLSKQWSYQVAQPGQAQPDDGMWLPYDTAEPWRYADVISGRYWLKTNFTSNERWNEPAIVVGLIPDSHRAFLNGHFVGGSDYYGDLAFYPFDPALLNSASPNELLISAQTRPNLNPGIVMPPEVGAFVGEFSHVRDAVLQNQIRFHLLKNIYFVLSILMSLACFFFAYFYRAGLATYYYCSLVLLLGTMHLMFYNPWIDSVFDYTLVRFFKVGGLALTQIVLFSAYLHTRKNYRAELVNNIIALAMFGAAVIALLVWPQTPSHYVRAYNAILIVAIAYSAVWAWPLMIFVSRKMDNEKTYLERLRRVVNFQGIFTISALIGVVSLVEALKLEYLRTELSSGTQAFMRDIGIAQPFLFAIFIFIIGTIDHIRSSRAAKMKLRRDQLMLDLVRIMRSSEDATASISAIHDCVSRFLRAERSTLYVFETAKNGSVFKAVYVAGLAPKRDVKMQMAPGEGPIGYTFQSGTPLLLADIRKDSRFSGPGARFPAGGNGVYRTGSCMIFPLFSGDRLSGVLTFADKAGETPFSRHDFQVGLEISPTLALLLDNRRMQEQLAKKKPA